MKTLFRSKTSVKLEASHIDKILSNTNIPVSQTLRTARGREEAYFQKQTNTWSRLPREDTLQVEELYSKQKPLFNPSVAMSVTSCAC